MWPQISGILDFGDFGFWILGILDFGDFGFWILDFGPLCSKSLCEAPNAPNLGIWNFGFWGFWGFWILGILDFGFWGFWILDFEVWGMEKFGCKIRDKFWILHKSKKTVHAAPGRRIYHFYALPPTYTAKTARKCTPPAGNEVTPARTGGVTRGQFALSDDGCWWFRNHGHHVAGNPPNVWIIDYIVWIGWKKRLNQKVELFVWFGMQQNSVVSEGIAVSAEGIQHGDGRRWWKFNEGHVCLSKDL